jgi:hypothetical protein
MKHRIASVVAAAALGIGFAGVDRAHAQAGAVDFSFAVTALPPQYDLTVTGVVDGTLLSDGNTFDVTGVSALTVDGTPISLAGWGTQPLDSYFGYAPDTAAITLDGSYLNLLFFASNSVNAGFGAGDEYTKAVNVSVAWGENSTYYSVFEKNYYQWSASFAAVPEPASVTALIVGLTAIGRMTRRRAG